jgi:hypothetical protein
VARCAFIKDSGERCRGVPIRGSSLCSAHDPSTQERRRRGAARGGRRTRSNPVREEIDEIRRLLRGATGELSLPESLEVARELGKKPRTLSRGDLIALGQLCNVRLRLLEVERRIREADELEERIRALEESLTTRAGKVNGWRR